MKQEEPSKKEFEIKKVIENQEKQSEQNLPYKYFEEKTLLLLH